MGFTGSVECRRSGGASLVTLVGRDAAGDPVHLSLLGALPAGLPARLDAASVDRIEAERYRISAGSRAWEVTAPRAYLHYDLTEAFYRALPPRRLPLGKRLFWRFVLAAAASPIGRWWLARRGRAGAEAPGAEASGAEASGRDPPGAEASPPGDGPSSRSSRAVHERP